VKWFARNNSKCEAYKCGAKEASETKYSFK
jgi:hypothetical protein